MKVARQDYSEEPFFFSETKDGLSRLVAWHNTEEGQKKIFYAVVNTFEEQIEYLFKEEIDSTADEDNRWIRTSGGITKENLFSLIKNFENWFFSDSSFQLCLREPDKKSYLAYDEHGIFFLYEQLYFAPLLKSLGLAESQRELINSKPHWCHRMKDSEIIINKFKDKLKGSSVFFKDESPEY